MALLSIPGHSAIVDGERQKPTPATMDFSENTEAYLYNVGAGMFFSQGNSWNTQASLDDEGRRVRFEPTGNGDYYLRDYCHDNQFNNWTWRNVFYDSETQMYVDRNNQPDYYFLVVDNGDGTFRITSSSSDPNFDLYSGSYFVGLKSGTALSPFLEPGEGYIDWALVTIDARNQYQDKIVIYNKAQELKEWIDKIEAQHGDAGSLLTVYLNEGASLAELQAAINTAMPIYIAALINNAPDKENVDVTSALRNPDFEQDETGWTVEAAPGDGPGGRAGNVRPGGNDQNHCYEAWNNSNFNIYQTLADMPVGVYEIEVQGFYRYGRDAAAWNAYQAQNVDYVKPEGVPVYVYLNNNATNFVNIFGDPVQITDASFYSGTGYSTFSKGGTNYYYPNDMASAAKAFSADMFTQSAFGLIANAGDDFQIGVKGNSSQLNDSWVIWDNFKLYYRGFKAEVVQPVLETAMADLNQYAGLLMGKTEHAALTSAMADAQAAIAAHDGEAMFHALNSLYNVKESVIASKDLFIAQEVATDVTNLQTALTDAAEKHYYINNRTAAETLVTNINNCTVYEGAQIAQLKTDVQNAINAIASSVDLYASLNSALTSLNETIVLERQVSAATKTAAQELYNTDLAAHNNNNLPDANVPGEIEKVNNARNALNQSASLYQQLNLALGELQTAIGSKANKDVIDGATTLYNDTKTQYDEGSIADANVNEVITSLNNSVTAISTSATLYTQLSGAIGRLETAIAEASEETAHVSASTLNRANLRLDQTKTDYNEGTIADNLIEKRVEIIDGLITNLTYSLNLYKDFATALASLNTILTNTAEAKANAAVRGYAQSLYDADMIAYDEGTIDDDKIEAEITKLNNAGSDLNGSVTAYATLVAPLASLNTALTTAAGTKQNATVLNDAQTLYNTDFAAYNEGTIADANIPAEITKMGDAETSLSSSTEAYATLAGAIPALQTAVTKKASKTASDAATALLAEVQAAYNEGTIADADIPAKVTEIGSTVEAVNASAALYADLAAAIGRLETAVAEASAATAHVSASTLGRANQRLTQTKTQYEEGSIADNLIEQRVDIIDGLIVELTNSLHLYQNFELALNSLGTALTNMAGTKMEASVRGVAQSLFETETNAYNTGAIDDDNIETEIAKLNNAISNLNTSAEAYSNFNSGITEYASAVTAASGNVTEALYNAASALLTTEQTAYAEGTTATADVAAEVAKMNNAKANLTAASGLEAKAKESADAQADATTALSQAATIQVNAQTDLNTKYIESARKPGLSNILTQFGNTVTSTTTASENLAQQVVAARQAEATTATDITVNNAASLTNAKTSLEQMLNTLNTNLLTMQNDGQNIVTKFAEAIAASANVIELAGDFGTFCTTVDLDFTDNEDLKAFIVTFNAEKKYAELTEIKKVPAGTGIVVSGSAGRYEVAKTEGAPAVIGNQLVGTAISIDLPVYTDDNANCVLREGTNGWAFLATDGGILAAGQAYLPLNKEVVETAGDAGISIFEPANLKVESGKLGTFIASYDIELPAGVKAYSAVIVGTEVKLTKIAEGGDVLDAGTPVIVYGDGVSVDKTYYGTPTVVGNQEVGALVGILDNRNVPAGAYVLQTQGDNQAFYKLGTAATGKFNRCYVVSASSEARLTISLDDVTLINALEATGETLKDGKYVINGKIVVVKNGKWYTANGQILK